MIRKHKLYSKPRKPYDLVRIKSEDEIVNKYVLKSKIEIWKAKAKLDKIRRIAKSLLRGSSEQEQNSFLEKLSKQGYNVKNVVEVLALTEGDILNRRLQTVVYKKGIATTPKGARQMITHKRIIVDKRIVNVPSYLISKDEETKISSKMSKQPKAVKEEKEVIDEMEAIIK